MGFFDKLKKDKTNEIINKNNEINIANEENESPSWIVYQDKMGEQDMSVRVDTKFADKEFAHTYYIQVSYAEEGTTWLPDKEFFAMVANVEDGVMKILNEVFEDKIVLLGCATFGGSAYITFASNLNVRWCEFIHEKVHPDTPCGAYLDDNMGYYNKVMFPEFVREKFKK